MRPLESIYHSFVFMGAIHFHVRSEGQIIKKAVYIAIGVQMKGMPASGCTMLTATLFSLLTNHHAALAKSLIKQCFGVGLLEYCFGSEKTP